MLHPHTKVAGISEEIGCGVVATRDIPKGTITWVLDPLDRIFNPQQMAELPDPCRETLLKYSYRNRHGEYVFCWDNTRFMNHSFTPNCITTAYNFELAVRDIAAGEELTNDYGSLNIIEPFHACDEGSGRRIVYSDDLARYYADWDRQLENAFQGMHRVDQPLRELLSDEQWETADDIAKTRQPMKSILHCLHRPDATTCGC
ncbi:MAG: SET domain-containing protein [Kiritimatiellales bacterium]|nr:SET domain-containing protein [Kiritimatiellota bacterium]MBL7012600.1 SET domain-containing protein [Kiritimatiellales bacterium]